MKHIVLPLVLIATPVFAEDPADYGTLNPDELSLRSVIARAEQGETCMTVCASGYMLTIRAGLPASVTIRSASLWVSAATWVTSTVVT